MRDRLSIPVMTVASVATAAGIFISATIAPASAQAPAASATAAAPVPSLKTPWGEPDLQGIWTDETDTPLQRSPKFANQEFFTEAQRVDLDRKRSALMGREKRSARRGEGVGSYLPPAQATDLFLQVSVDCSSASR